MRCREALNRLNRLDRSRQPDPELLEHLKSCSACARQAEAVRELNRAYAELSVPDESDLIPWPEQVRRVEAAVRTSRNQPKETPLMSTLKKQFQLRPKLSAGLAAALVVLLAATLIPFKIDQTVGFEVAVAGVNRDLALNQEKLQEMLRRLGLNDARIEVKGCEATCNLVVSDLNSAKDAGLLRFAFEEVGGNEVVVETRPLDEGVSEPALFHFYHRISIKSNPQNVDEGEMQHIVIERLGTDFEGAPSLFFTDEDGQTMRITNTDGSVQELSWVSEGEALPAGDHQVVMSVDASKGDPVKLGERLLYFTAEDGDRTRAALIDPVDIVDGRLTDEARAALEAQGFVVEESNDGEGTLTVRLSGGNIGEGHEMTVQVKLDETGLPVSKEGSELPEGYSLSQNYPNPFNPDTWIDYAIPRSEHVTIEIFNINGQKVRTLLDEIVPAGTHTVSWDATSDSGERVASGVYLYRLAAGELVTSKKMTLLK
jgi:hypothetical protein